jgi:hypothetical protein
MMLDEWHAVLATAPATPNQRGAIMREFERLGFGEADRAERLAICAALAGLENLGSTADLRMGEAGQVYRVLLAVGDRGELLAAAGTGGEDQAAEVDDDDEDQAAEVDDDDEDQAAEVDDEQTAGPTLAEAIRQLILAFVIGHHLPEHQADGPGLSLTLLTNTGIRIMISMVGERACEHCGNPFTPRRSTARFCGNSCRAAHGRGRAVSVPNANANASTSLSRLATVTAIRPDTPAWDPSGEPRRSQLTNDLCPECETPMTTGRRGTWRYCPACERLTVPPAVARQHNEATGQRRVLSGPERDQRDLVLAVCRDHLLARLRAAGLPSGSAVAELLAGKIRDAGSEQRLAEVEELLGRALAIIRERQATVPAIAGEIVEGELVDDNDDDDDDDDDGTYCYDTAGRLVPAIWDGSAWVPATPMPVAGATAASIATPRLAIAAPAGGAAPAVHWLTWADALAACGWRLAATIGGCQVDDHGRLCGAETTRGITGGWVCAWHYNELCAVIIKARRSA